MGRTGSARPSLCGPVSSLCALCCSSRQHTQLDLPGEPHGCVCRPRRCSDPCMQHLRLVCRRQQVLMLLHLAELRCYRGRQEGALQNAPACRAAALASVGGGGGGGGEGSTAMLVCEAFAAGKSAPLPPPPGSCGCSTSSVRHPDADGSRWPRPHTFRYFFSILQCSTVQCVCSFESAR